VLGELTGQQETDGSLDLSASEGLLLVVTGQATSFKAELLEEVIDKAVHDGHSLGGDAKFLVYHLQHFEDVGVVALNTALLLLLLLDLGGLLDALGGLLGWGFSHFISFHTKKNIQNIFLAALWDERPFGRATVFTLLNRLKTACTAKSEIYPA
jgi:hypothetical protein